MSVLVEAIEFVTEVMRIDLDTLVKGYDGKNLGPSNEQAQALANRTQWLKSKLHLLESAILGMKDPVEIMDDHVNAKDPHKQYLTQERGDTLYVDIENYNKPSGYLKLDENGYLPLSIAKLYEARYLIADNEADRLASSSSKNITICLQTDENVIYYLNPNADPSVADNWSKGESTEINQVVNVFGRMGSVKAEVGDYNADQITETDKQFATKKEKLVWNAKQDELVSGKNLSTVFGKSLLGKDDINLNDVSNLSEIIKSILYGEDGIEVYHDDENKIIKIKGASGGSGSLDPLTIVTVKDAVAGTEYKYHLDDAFNFDYLAHANKQRVIAEQRERVIDGDEVKSRLSTSPVTGYDDDGFFPAGTPMTYDLEESEGTLEKYKTEKIALPQGKVGAMGVKVEKYTNGIVPILTNANPVNGIRTFSSPVYGNFYSWKAFQRPLTDEERKRVPDQTYWSDDQIWRSRRVDVQLGFTSEVPLKVSSYGFAKFEEYYWRTTSTPPTDWEIQARNEDTEEWVVVDTRIGEHIQVSGEGYTNYSLANPVKYKQYRLLVLNVINPSARTSIPRMQFYTEPSVLIKSTTGEYFSFDTEGNVVLVPEANEDDFYDKGFVETIIPGEVDTVKDYFPIELCSDLDGVVTVQFYSTSPKISIMNPVVPDESSDGLYSITASEYYHFRDGERAKAAFTYNGVDYFTYANDKWSEIGDLKADADSAKLLSLFGTSLADISKIPSTAWDTLLDNAVVPMLGAAFAKEVTHKDDPVIPKTLELRYDGVINWDRCSYEKVNITLTKRFLIFKPIENGTYKFCYRFL